MKKYLTISLAMVLFAFYSNMLAQTDTTKAPQQTPKHGKNFVDNNGDGYNDNAPDHDGDGIPNGIDPDFTGPRLQKGKKPFIDLNGDGIDDNTGKARARKGKGGYGPSDGTGNHGMGPKDGTGNGSGDGTQSGSQSSGSNSRGKKWGKK